MAHRERETRVRQRREEGRRKPKGKDELLDEETLTGERGEEEEERKKGNDPKGRKKEVRVKGEEDGRDPSHHSK